MSVLFPTLGGPTTATQTGGGSSAERSTTGTCCLLASRSNVLRTERAARTADLYVKALGLPPSSPFLDFFCRVHIVEWYDYVCVIQNLMSHSRLWSGSALHQHHVIPAFPYLLLVRLGPGQPLVVSLLVIHRVVFHLSPRQVALAATRGAFTDVRGERGT